MTLAHAAALRSEDPYRKVGAAALDADNRVIGTAYNGLYPGFKAQDTFWASRDERQKYMLHAEINLCSLFRRGEAWWHAPRCPAPHACRRCAPMALKPFITASRMTSPRLRPLPAFTAWS